jgi:hypothetical protein
MVRTALRPNPQKKQTVMARSIPAPIGGWDAQSPLAAMPPQNAVILDNWIPRSGYVEIRRGYIPQQTGTPGPVETLMAYRGGPTGDKLFAASAGNLYDVTALGGALSAPVYSGATSNRWNYSGFSNPGGEWLIAVNGADTPIGYNAAAWAALPTITGSSGSITLNPDKLFCVCPHQGRLLFGELDTLHVWFPAAGAVGGAMQLLDLGSVFNKGGRLVGIATWSWQFGVTADEYAVFMTDQGQIALYSGIDPSNASDWALTGVYNFGPPVGPRALVTYGADLALITTDGIIPLSQALKLDRTQDNTVALTAQIKDVFSQAVRAYSGNYGWQGLLYPGDTTSSDTDADGGSLAIFNIPISTLGTSMQFVSNLSTGAWCRFLNIDAFCWETANNAVYFGGAEGVYQWDVGASDDGQTITAEMKTAFSSFGSATTKRFTMIRPLLKTSGLVQPAIDVDTDYQNNVPTATPTVVDVGSTTPETRFDWTSIGGIGYVAAPHMVVSLRDDPSVENLATDAGLLNTLGVDAEGDTLAATPGLPYDVPCQCIGFDIMYQVGGQL